MLVNTHSAPYSQSSAVVRGFYAIDTSNSNVDADFDNIEDEIIDEYARFLDIDYVQ